MDKLIADRTGISAKIADEAVSCVARGTGKALEWVQFLDSGIVEDNITKKYRG
jgi:rod shape-determining protein MreB